MTTIIYFQISTTITSILQKTDSYYGIILYWHVGKATMWLSTSKLLSKICGQQASSMCNKYVIYTSLLAWYRRHVAVISR